MRDKRTGVSTEPKDHLYKERFTKNTLWDKFDSFSNYLIITLVILALLLGYKISKNSSSETVTDFDNTATSINNIATGDLSLAYLAQQFPNPDSTQQEIDAFDVLIGDNATDTTSFEITNCEADPIIIRFTKGSEITIVNLDDVDRVISFEDFRLEIPSGESLTSVIGENLGYGGVGNFGFLCDGNLGGVFQITP